MCAHDEVIRVMGGPAGVARYLHIQPPSVHGWRDEAGRYTIPRSRLIELASPAELRSGGAVKRVDLFPEDWHRIWPELADSTPNPPPAPASPARAAMKAVAVGEGDCA